MLRVPNGDRLRRAADAALATGIGGFGLLHLLTSAHPTAWGGRGPLQVVLVLAFSLPLAWRSRFPILAASTENAATSLLVVLSAPHQPPLEAFLADILATYSLGAHTNGRRAWGGLALQFGIGIPFAFAQHASGFKTGDLAGPVVFTLVFWAIGRIIQGRRQRERELRALALELEAQRDLQAAAAVAVERGRIARELHDIVAHNVSMMVVQAGAAERVLRGDEPDVRRALEAISGTGRATIDEMRRLLGVLRAGDDGLALSPQPGLADLEQLVRGVREAGLPVELRVEGTPVPLPQGIDLSAFRIVQEALTNALKHAGPARAQVTVRYGGGAVELEVRDDGAPGSAGIGTGNGLVGMRERVAIYGGELEAGRAPAGGFAVRARLPLTAATATP